MNNIGKYILSEQNTDLSINSIAAQRQIYSDGKLFFYLQIIIAVPIPILLAIIQPHLGKTEVQVSWAFALYGIIAAFGELVIENKVSTLKKLAASIQEEFDCKVLSIPWNSTLLSSKPDIENIFHYSKKFKISNEVSKLYNWYSLSVEKLNTNIASIICQRTNCSYDFAIRKKYSSVVIVTAIITFLLVLIISACYGLTLSSFLLTVLLPCVPVFILAYKQVLANKDSLENLTNLRTQIEGILSLSKINTQVETSILRQIQDKIYYNRILSPLLPDKLYDKIREGLEEEMNFSAEQKVKQLQEQLP
jgi:hypothetical protein